MELVIRATIIYWFLWLVVRGTGKRSLAEMSPLDLLIIVIIGDMVEKATTADDMSITGAVIVVSVLLLWAFVADWVGLLSRRADKVLVGEPVIMIHDGRVLEDRARKERLTADEVRAAAREQGIANMSSIRFGVMEPDGKFSFITTDAEPATADTPASPGERSGQIDSAQESTEP